MSGYRAQCVCGAWPTPGEVERSFKSPTSDAGWVVVVHDCACGRRTRFAHDTEGRMANVTGGRS